MQRRTSLLLAFHTVIPAPGSSAVGNESMQHKDGDDYGGKDENNEQHFFDIDEDGALSGVLLWGRIYSFHADIGGSHICVKFIGGSAVGGEIQECFSNTHAVVGIFNFSDMIFLGFIVIDG